MPNIFWAKNARLWAKHTNPARARAVIDRQWGLGENFLARRLVFFFYKSSTQKRKVEKLIARLEMNRLSEGYKQAVDKIWDHMAKNRFSG